MLRPSDWVLWSGLVVATVGAVAVAAQSPTAATVVVGSLVAFLAIAVRAPAPAFVFVGTTLIAVSTGGPAVPVVDGGAASISLRVAGAAALIVAGLRHGRPQRPGRPHSTFVAMLAGSLMVYIVAATALDKQYGALLLYSTATIGMVACLTAVSSWVPIGELRTGLVAALATVVSLSLVVGLLAPGIGIEQGRLRGIAENANGLGCYAFTLGALALTVIPRRAVAAVLLALSAVAIVWSGSRNSTIALAVVAAVVLLGTSRWPLKIAAGLVALSGVMVYQLYEAGFDSTLGRIVSLDNTRAETFSYALRVLDRYPWTGLGLGNEAVIVASTPMRAIAQAGVWGALAVLGMWFALLVYGKSGGARTLAVAVGIIGYSLFEGVLLSPIGPFLLVLLAALITVQRIEEAAKLVDRQPVPV